MIFFCCIILFIRFRLQNICVLITCMFCLHSASIQHTIQLVNRSWFYPGQPLVAKRYNFMYVGNYAVYVAMLVYLTCTIHGVRVTKLYIHMHMGHVLKNRLIGTYIVCPNNGVIRQYVINCDLYSMVYKS